MYQLHQVPSEAQIRKYLRRVLYGRNVFCPWCRSRLVYHCQGRFRCRRCRQRFSLLSGTWLANLKLPLPKFWLILWCWTSQVPVKQAKALNSLSEKAIRHWYGSFRAHLPENPVILQKIVQLDEAYFPGISLIAGKQTGSRKLAYAIHRKTSIDKRDAARFLFQHVRPYARLQTDGSRIYQRIDQWWPVQHRRDIHKKWEFALTSEIEGLFGNLRTFIRRMYHHSTPEYLPEYVSEFCVRFSSPEIFESPRAYLSKTLTLVPTG